MNTQLDDPQPAPAASDVLLGVQLALDANTHHGIVRLCGELDLASQDRLQAVLDQLRGDGYRHVVLEVCGLGFLGCAAAGVLARAAAVYAAAGGSLTLIHPTAMVARVLSATGLDHLSTPPAISTAHRSPRRHQRTRRSSGSRRTGRRVPGGTVNGHG